MNDPKQAFRFLNTMAIMFCGWFLLEEYIFPSPWLYDYWLFANHLVLKAVIYPVQWTLQAMGYKTMMSYRIIGILGTSGIKIENPCLGFSLFATYCMLPIAFPSPRKLKIWFIVIGIIFIHLMNIVRMVGLSLTLVYANNKIGFDYHTKFNFIVYLFTFLMWMLFIKLSLKSTVIRLKK
jgi:exosortase/archaeosortase family protein